MQTVFPADPLNYSVL